MINDPRRRRPLRSSRPALGRDRPQVLHHPERKRPEACLFNLPSMGVGVESLVPDSDLAFIGDVGSDPGDELKVVHPLEIFARSSE